MLLLLGTPQEKIDTMKQLYTIKNSKLLCSDQYIKVLSEYDVKKPKEYFELNMAQTMYFNYHYNEVFNK